MFKSQKCKKRRKRTVILPETLQRLEDVFGEERWPSRQAKLKLAQDLNQSEQFVNIWFQNKRARIKREQAKIQQDDDCNQQVQNFFQVSENESDDDFNNDDNEINQEVESDHDGKVIFVENQHTYDNICGFKNNKILIVNKLAQLQLNGQVKQQPKISLSDKQQIQAQRSPVQTSGELNFSEICLRDALSICFQDQGRFIIDISDDLLPYFFQVILTYSPAFLRAQTIVAKTESCGRRLKDVIDEHCITFLSQNPKRPIVVRLNHNQCKLDPMNIKQKKLLVNLPITIEYPGLRFHKKTYFENIYPDEDTKANDERYNGYYCYVQDEYACVEQLHLLYVSKENSTAYLGPRIENKQQPFKIKSHILTPTVQFKQHINASTSHTMPVFMYNIGLEGAENVAHVIVEACSNR